ncbi:FtsX-like permease family protein [Actinophytocola xanthii]|uniref:ABC3 transporter permease C-terminal domain-containing protein n=1 Tax=Actinophytocola xanthii TaxID=1912961 RepID=A0A1Q8CC71_9PSEU|nr:FtsX-like permease family protein [Actinophytocola xanthii]OLF11922.1 hypothetical protein BU204_29565 [Actinophytocola xanthii]
MRQLALASIRHRRGSYVAVFVAVLCAAALLTALGVLFESGLRAGVEPQRYAGASVVVGGQQTMDVPEDLDPSFAERVPLPAEVVEQVAAVDGVARVVGESSVPISVEGVSGARGFGWSSASLTPLSLRDGVEPRGAGEVVLDAELANRAGLSVGDQVPLAIGGVPGSYRVTGVAAPEGGAATGRVPAVFFTDELARELSGRPDQVDVVGVVARDGVAPEVLAERISAQVDGVVTYTGSARGDVEFLDVGAVRAQLVVLSLAFAGSAMMIAMLVVAGTLGLAVQQRRREMALLRAVAATPRQIHRLVGTEILWVAAAAAVPGAAAGIGVAFLLRAVFVRTGLLPEDFGLAVGPVPPVAALLLVVGTARLAGWVAARRAARIDPVSALREAAVEPRGLGRWRVRAGVLAAVGWLATSALPAFLPGEGAVAGAASSAMLGVVSVALLGPLVVAAAARFAGRWVRSLAPVAGSLAVAGVAASTRRLAAVVTPLVLAVAMASVQIFTQTTIAAAAAEQADDGVVADYVVIGEAGLAPAVADVVRGLRGVETVTPVSRSQVFVAHQQLGAPAVTSFAAQGVPADGLERTLDLDPRAGDLSRLRGETVALGASAAETLGVGVGDRIDLRLGDGTRLDAEVVATYGRGLGFGEVTLPHDLLAAHTTNRLDESLLVRAEGPVEITGFPGVTVLDRAALAAAGQEQRDTESWTSLVALVVILAYLAIAVVNTLVMATAARSREFALLRMVGARRRQVLSMTRIEALLVVAIAAVVGTLAAAPALLGVSFALTGSVVPAVPPLVYLAIVGVTALLGLVAIGIPTRVALRTRPMEAMGLRE